MILLYNRVRCRQNVGCRTVILFQFYHFCVSEVFFEFKNVPDVSSAPLIDTLVIVTYYTDVVMFLCQHLYEFVLDMVSILIFVYHYVSESFLIFSQCEFVFFENSYCIEQQVIKVHRVILFQQFFVSGIDFIYHSCFWIAAVQCQEFIRAHFLFLAVADDSEEV